MKLFSKPAAVLDELGKLRQAEKYRREDRGIVANFFNGAPPLTDEEAAELGFTVNVNHLFGYREIADAADRSFGLFTKPANLIEIELHAAPSGKRPEWGMAAALEASRVLRKISAFKTAYQGASGDAALHGEALFFFPNKTFPLPRHCPLSRMLIPDDVSTDIQELSHFGVEGALTLRELRHFWERAPKGWNKEPLGKILKKIYAGNTDGRELDPNNFEEAEYRRQENSATSETARRRPGADVSYLYQQRVDKPGAPLDLTIILRGEREAGEGADKAVLFQGEAVFPTIGTCLQPFFMDCIIGGAPKWHRVLGLGPLNYQINHAVELLVNRAQQATMEGSMNLWQANNTTTREAAQQILMRHNGILPEGLNLVQNRFQPNLSGIMEMIQFFRQAGSKNASGVTPNGGQKNDQLEVQAMAEMNQGASMMNNRTSNWYDYLDRMWTEAFRRLTNPYIDKHEPGYSEVMDFQSAMARRGIPLYWLQSANVTVRAVRLVGDGLRQKELAAAQYLTQNRANFAPEVQPKITRLCTGLVLDDYRLAEDLTPMQEEEDVPQTMRAEAENAIMLTQRTIQAPKAEDIDELHITQHFPAMEMLISDAVEFQKAAFTPQQAKSFQVIGGHVIAHIKRIESRAQNNRKDPARDIARAFMEQLNQVAAMGDKMVNNMEQTQQGAAPEIEPAEMAKLQLEVEKLALAREKLAHSTQKFERTQDFREQSTAFEQNLKLEKDHRENQRGRQDSARSDVELALSVANSARPK
jgi:hypothetical protein